MSECTLCICIGRGGGRRKEALRLRCGSRRIPSWGTKEKERVQIYQLLGSEDGSFRKLDRKGKKDEAKPTAKENGKSIRGK